MRKYRWSGLILLGLLDILLLNACGDTVAINAPAAATPAQTRIATHAKALAILLRRLSVLPRQQLVVNWLKSRLVCPNCVRLPIGTTRPGLIVRLQNWRT